MQQPAQSNPRPPLLCTSACLPCHLTSDRLAADTTHSAAAPSADDLGIETCMEFAAVRQALEELGEGGKLWRYQIILGGGGGKGRGILCVVQQCTYAVVAWAEPAACLHMPVWMHYAAST